MNTVVMWRGHRVGSAIDTQWFFGTVLQRNGDLMPLGGNAQCELEAVTLPAKLAIVGVARLPLRFNRDFAELFGITGVEFEHTEG